MTVLKEGLRDRISPSCTLSQNGYGDCRTVWNLANVTESMSWSNSERARVRAWAKGRRDRRCHMQCAHVGVGILSKSRKSRSRRILDFPDFDEIRRKTTEKSKMKQDGARSEPLGAFIMLYLAPSCFFPSFFVESRRNPDNRGVVESSIFRISLRFNEKRRKKAR